MTKSYDLSNSVNPDSINATRIVPASITSTELAAGCVTAAKIPDGEIINSKIASSAGISSSKLDYLQNGTGAVTRTVQQKLRDSISVKDFGALGDGSTNDAPAIKAADLAAAAAGKSLYFPSGVYMVDLDSIGESLTMNTSWIGEDRFKTIIRRKDFYWLAGSGKPGFILDMLKKQNLVLANMTFDGQVTTATAAALNPPVPNQDLAAPGQYPAPSPLSEDQWSQTYGVQFNGCWNITVTNCEFVNMLRAGLRYFGEGLYPRVSGTYSATGTSTVTVTTSGAHGLQTGDVVNAVFTSGTVAANNGGRNPLNTYYTVTVTGSNTLTLTNQGDPSAVTASGDVDLYKYEPTPAPTDGWMAFDHWVTNCSVRRTRGWFGDSYLFVSVQNIWINNCYAYDFQRIGFVYEQSAGYGRLTPCKGVVTSNCVAEFGHDAIGAENNIGFWTEVSSNMSWVNCGVRNCLQGFLQATSDHYGEGLIEGFEDSGSYVGCWTEMCQFAHEIGVTNRSMTVMIDDCHFECNQYSAPYAEGSRGYAAGIRINYYDDGSNPDSRYNIKVSNTNFDCVGWTTNTAHFAPIYVWHGQDTTSDVNKNVLIVDNVTTQWLQANGTQNKTAVIAAFEQGGGTSNPALRYGHWGDLVVNGSNASQPNSTFKGSVYVRNCTNQTTGYFLVSLESGSSYSNFVFEGLPFSMRRGDYSGSALSGSLFVNNCPLFDPRDFLPKELTRISNTTIADANPSNPARNSVNSDMQNLYVSGCRITRPLYVGFDGDSSSARRPLLAHFVGNHFYINIKQYPMLRFTQGFPLYCTVNLAGNVFQHVRTGSAMSGTEVIIDMPINSLSQIYMVGTGNVFDAAAPHICKEDDAPSYNDAPAVAAYPWSYAPIGYTATFEGA